MFADVRRRVRLVAAAAGAHRRGQLHAGYRIARALAVNISTLEFVQVAKARAGKRAVHRVRRDAAEHDPSDAGRHRAALHVRSCCAERPEFFGLGVQPPYADLGSLVRENIASLGAASAVAIMPAVAIAILTVGVNLLIDGLPHRGRRRRGRRRRRTLMRRRIEPARRGARAARGRRPAGRRGNDDRPGASTSRSGAARCSR